MNHAESNVWTEGGDFIGRDKHIYGDEVHGDKITYQGPVGPRLNYRGEVAGIITYYTQTFVGRQYEWNELARFAGQEAPGYMLVEAPAGYGKTALMAHLIQRHETDRWEDAARPNLLYFFIRQEGGCHTPEAFLQALNSQLLKLINLSGGVPPDLTSLRGQFSDLWPQALEAASPDHPLLLIVDGLDELASGEVTIAQLLPSDLAPYAHVVVTSRPNPEPLEQVALTHPFKKADVLRLYAFEEPEIRALLQEYGAAEDIATSLAPRVLAMTKGEPLFARFVCQEVAKEGEMALVHLEQNPPADVEAYFRQQFRQLDSLAEGDLAWDILQLLTVTLGGITREEIAEVLGASKRRIRQALEPIQRFLLGQDRLELMHLQLRKVVAGEFSPREQAAYQEKLLTWCRSYQEQGWPQETPDYILAHYAQHLSDAGQREALYALIHKRWMDLKFQRTFSHRAFAEDVDQAIAVAGAEDPPNLVQVVRCCLAHATLRGLATDIPPEILGVLAQVGQVERALDYIALVQEVHNRSWAYALIAEALVEQGRAVEAKAALGQALKGVDAFKYEQDQVSILSKISRLFTQMGDKLRAIQVADHALGVAEAIEHDEDRSSALYAVTEALAQVGEFDRAIAVAETIEVHRTKGFAFREVVQALAKSGDKRKVAEIFYRVGVALEAVEGGWVREDALSQIAQVLVEVGAFGSALATSEAVGKMERKASILSKVPFALAEVEDAKRASEILDRVLQVAGDEISALCAVAEALGKTGDIAKAGEILHRALQVAGDETSALCTVAQALGKVGDVAKAVEILERALSVAKALEAEASKVFPLLAVAEALHDVGNESKATEIFDQALAAAEMIEDGKDRAFAFCMVARTLAQVGDRVSAVKTLDRALAVVQAMDKDWTKACPLYTLAHTLVEVGDKARAGEVATQAFVAENATRGIRLGVGERMCELAEIMVWAGAFGFLLEALKSVESERYRIDVLCRAAKALASAGDTDGVMRAAAAIETKWDRLCALSAAADILVQTGEMMKAADVAEQAIVAAGMIKDARAKAIALSRITQALTQAEAFARAMVVAKAIMDDEAKALALQELAQPQTQMGAFNQVLVLAEAIKGRKAKASVLSSAAQAMAELGEFDQALMVAEAIEHLYVKTSTLRIIAQTLAKSGLFDRALKVVEAIEYEVDKATALSELARVLTEAGDRAKAEEMASRAVDAAKAISHTQEEAFALSKVAQSLAKAGMFDRALSATRAIAIGEDRASSLCEIGKLLAEAGDKARAIETFEQAVMVAKKWGYFGFGVWRKSFALCEIVEAMGRFGAFDRARAVAEMIDNQKTKASALRALAQAMAEAGKFDQALELTATIGDEEEKVPALIEVIESIAKAGLLDRAQAEAKVIGDNETKAIALFRTVHALAGMRSFDQALAVANEIEFGEAKVAALYKVCEALAQAGYWTRAVNVANETQTLTAAIGGKDFTVSVLGGIAHILAKAGLPTQAQKVWREAFDMARLAGRESIFQTLGHNAMALTVLDQGQTLWQIYEAVMEVESWWGAPGSS